MSDKPILQKLSVSENSQFLLVNPPAECTGELGALPTTARLVSETSCLVEASQVVVANQAERKAHIPRLKEMRTPKEMLWIAYHKGTFNVKTDSNCHSFHAYAKTIGLQGVVIISIDEDWTALRPKKI